MAGGPSGWSATYHFKTMPEGEDWSPSLAVFGDLGSENAQSLPRLKSDSAMGMYDAILHVGEFCSLLNVIIAIFYRSFEDEFLIANYKGF